MNSFLPGLVARKFRRSRIVAFSTGNVYGLVPRRERRLDESGPAPAGRRVRDELPGPRTDLRALQPGPRHSDGPDPAELRRRDALRRARGPRRKVLAGQPIDLAMGYFNVIWQGDANAMALRAFDHAATPPAVLNVAGPGELGVRQVAERFGKRFGRAGRSSRARRPPTPC